LSDIWIYANPCLEDPNVENQSLEFATG